MSRASCHSQTNGGVSCLLRVVGQFLAPHTRKSLLGLLCLVLRFENTAHRGGVHLCVHAFSTLSLAWSTFISESLARGSIDSCAAWGDLSSSFLPLLPSSIAWLLIPSFELLILSWMSWIDSLSGIVVASAFWDTESDVSATTSWPSWLLQVCQVYHYLVTF